MVDRKDCPRGLFSDSLFENDADRGCDQDLVVWSVLIAIILLLRVIEVVYTWRRWLFLSKHRAIQQAGRARTRYYFQKRLPVIPVLVTLASLAAMIMWILASVNLARFSNGVSLLMLGVYLTLHMLVSSVTFTRYVRMGLKIVPLTTTSNNKKKPWFFRPSAGSEDRKTSSETEENSPNKSSLAPTRTTATSSAAHISGDATTRFDAPMKLLLFTNITCILAGTISASVFGILLENKDFVMTISCIFFAVAYLLAACMYFWQLHRIIACLKEMEDTEMPIRTLKRQRMMGVAAHLLYACIALFMGIDKQSRPWYVMYMIDLTIVLHGISLLFLSSKKKKNARTVTSDVRGHRFRLSSAAAAVPVAMVASAIEDGYDDDVPTFEEAWDEGFRWRRWSTGYELKERKAFAREYKQWASQKAHGVVPAEPI